MGEAQLPLVRDGHDVKMGVRHLEAGHDDPDPLGLEDGHLRLAHALGETALVHFDGAFSHAIRKGPLLRRGEGPTRALFAAEHITPRVPDAAERALADAALAAIPFARPLAYARVDLIRDDAGAPRLLELELTEPSLFFAHAPDSAMRLARCVLARAGG